MTEPLLPIRSSSGKSETAGTDAGYDSDSVGSVKLKGGRPRRTLSEKSYPGAGTVMATAKGKRSRYRRASSRFATFQYEVHRLRELSSAAGYSQDTI